TLLQQLVELLQGAALKKHVPVRTWWLRRLGFDALALHEGAHLAVLAQPVLRDLGVVSERDLKHFAVFSLVLHHLTWREIVVPVGFIRHGTHATASQYAVCH